MMLLRLSNAGAQRKKIALSSVELLRFDRNAGRPAQAALTRGCYMRRAAILVALLVCFAAPARFSIAHAEPSDIDVAYLPLLGSAQLFVMQSEGWAKDEELALRMTRFNSGTAIVQALASGKFDVAIMAMAPVIVARAAGVNLRVVAAMHDVNSHAFVGVDLLSDAYKQTAAPADAFAKFFKDNGRPAKIATLPKGTLPDTAIRYYIDWHKIKPEHYQILNQGDEQVLQSMLAGAADAVSLAEPLMTIIKAKVSGSQILAAGATLMPGHPGFVFAVRETFIEKNPGAVRKLVGMNARATELIKKDPARASKSALNFIGRGLLDEELMTAAISSPHNPVASDPRILVAGTEMMQDFQVKIGVQARKVPTDELFDFRFTK
jgi:NitT/TauT family transport system substrate-binding protein